MLRLVSIILLFISLFGCENPFTTRKAEPPDLQNPSNFIPPVSAEIVFRNIEFAIQEGNVENYIRSFVDTSRSDRQFTFVPEQGVVANYPNIFLNWQLQDERRYLTQLLQVTPTDSGRILRFFEENKIPGTTTATFTENYELIVRHTRQSENMPAVVRGQSKFWLEQNYTGDWAIYRWEDITNGIDPTWSELKVWFQ